MNNHARSLFCTLTTLFTSSPQKSNFRTLMALFLRGDGRPHPRHAIHKSASALGRFLNKYSWNARSLIRYARQEALQKPVRVLPLSTRKAVQTAGIDRLDHPGEERSLPQSRSGESS